jgi:Flp pilus assembly protein TadB
VFGPGTSFVALAGAGLGGSSPTPRGASGETLGQQFEEQFPEVIDLLARSARAGHALQAGLQEVAEEAPDPCGEEFRQVFEEQRFGLPLGESLLGLADRVDLVDVRMFVTSVLIQKETGETWRRTWTTFRA